MTDNENTDNETVGATFYRCALQVNPAHYAKSYRGRGEDHGLSEEEYVKAIIRKCVERDIKVIAITDHNNVGSVNFFVEEANQFDITVFPGFEINSSEGIHILCLYSPGTSIQQLERHLGELKIRNIFVGSTSLSEKSFAEIIECVNNKQKGQTIAAHITSDNGLLKELTGEARINAWKNPNLLCAQIPGSYNNLPDKYKWIINNTDPKYKRESVPEGDLPIAFVNATDVLKPDDLALDRATCLIKMDKPSLEGLRQAFLDPSSRIRLNSDTNTKSNSVEFKEISWEGGLLDGCNFKFNKNLNTIIGGRGAGKSTIIESLRCVLGLESFFDDVNKIHDGIKKQVLGEGTEITLQVQFNFPRKQIYWIKVNIPNSPNIALKDKTILKQKPKDMFPHLQIFSQHELSGFANDLNATTGLIKKFVDQNFISDIEERKQNMRSKLQESRNGIIKFTEEKNKLENNILDLERNKEKLNTFDKVNLESKHSQKIQTIKAMQLLETVFEKINNIANLITTMENESSLGGEYLKNFETTEDFIASGKLKINLIIDSLESVIKSSTVKIKKSKNSALEQLEELSSEWKEKFNTVENSFSETLRELQEDKEAFDITKKFIDLRTKIESLKHLPNALEDNIVLLDKAKDARVNFISAWDRIKSEEVRKNIYNS